MDDLRVESYEAKEVAAKKRSISKRVAVAGGVIALTLGLFGLTGCVDGCVDVRGRNDPPDFPYVVGGSGSWFVSILESA